MHARSWWVGILSGLAVAAGTGGCAKNKANEVVAEAREASGGLQSVPTDPDSILNQLKRFRGQTKFLNFEGGFGGGLQGGAVPEGARAAAADKGGREFQESDVFKVGKAGSKLLYLLNNYRGLQVVSFKDGVDQKNVKLVSRVASSGNYPQNMYYSAKDDRLYVLERATADQNDPYNREQKSALLIYDVSKPETPKLTTTTKFDGELADSRFDQTNGILYVATSVYSNRSFGGDFGIIGRRPGGTTSSNTASGRVYSFSIKGDKTEETGKLELTSPISSRENMNIVEADGKFYLLAILSQSPWSWWDRKSSVEVVDISDTTGKIAPVMTVTTKGVINKRSQTYLKNGTLVVVSNYDSDRKNRQGRAIQRIALETFTFPKRGIKPITQALANLRKERITWIMTNTKFEDPDERDAKYKELVESDKEGPDGGLRGRIVDLGNGRLQKLVADSELTTGASIPGDGGDAMSATLNDVRVQDNLLFVTWVPTNLIDPLDVFDVSAPEKGLEKDKHHVGHHEFKGWLVRAQPMFYKGTNYLLGLGFEQEENVRRPTAKLFEIDTKNLAVPVDGVRELKITPKGSLVMKGGDVWVDFDRSDKYVEIKQGADGKGSVLFSIHSWGKKPLSGGKLLGFDLNKAGMAGAFSEGTVIAGDAGWLRRVFSNPELGTLHTFSDVQLATFQVAGVGEPKKVAEAISLLELARNIRAYETLGKYGVQLVESPYSYNSRPTLQFRLVDQKRPDAEITSLKAPVLTVTGGRYVSHVVNGDGILVLSEDSNYKQATETTEASQTTTYTVSKVSLDGDKLASTATTWSHTHVYKNLTKEEIEAQAEADKKKTVEQGLSERYGRVYGSKLVQTSDGKTLVNTSQDLRLITVGATLGNTKVDTTACTDLTIVEGGKIKTPVYVEVHSSKAYAKFTQFIVDKDKKGVVYGRHFLGNATINGAKLACANSANVPGRPVLVDQNKSVVSDDQKVTDILVTKSQDGKQVYYSAKAENLLVSVKLDGAKAELVDAYDPAPATLYSMKVFGVTKPTLAFLESSTRGDGNDFVVLGLDDQFRFTKDSNALPVNLGKYATLASLQLDIRRDARQIESYLAVLTSNSRAAVLHWNVRDRKPVVTKLVEVDEQGLESKDQTETIRLQGYWYGSDRSIHFTQEGRSFEFAQGMQGVKQVLVKD